METVVVKEVVGKPTGWFEIELEDGRTVATKLKKLADQAEASQGNAVAVDLTEKVNGKFTNIYLNKIEPTGNGDAPKPAAAVQETVAAQAAPQDAKGERIARQWAYGRAVEIGTAFGSLTFPLDDESVAKLQITADTLLKLTK